MKKNLLWPTEIYSFNSNTIDNNKVKERILEKEKMNQVEVFLM